MKRLLAIVAAALLTACGPDPDTAMAITVPAQATGRVVVNRIGVIPDELAYGHRRGIYTVTDNKTGAEYIGISGIGITEIGQHSCGKSCTDMDER